MILADAAFSWSLAARRGAQGMADSLSKQSNAAAGLHGNALRVSLSASMAVLHLLLRVQAISGEVRLALNADRLTESVIIILKEY